MKNYRLSRSFIPAAMVALTLMCPLFSTGRPQDNGSKLPKLTLKGKVFDRTTTKEVHGVEVAVLRADSTVAGATTGGSASWRESGGKYYLDSVSDYKVTVDKLEGDYLLRLSRAGYDTTYIPYQVHNLGRREIERDVPNIYIARQQKVHELDEIVVRASKIKFYNKGDTVVYDAEAFALPEGSTLDALVKQLPGVEIREGGAIYVNGRYVESLMLNGKDFFKGDKDVMLQNIGAYMVKNVEVYEKQGEISRMTGTRLQEDMQYVMDVKLKKDYMAGTMGNVEAALGTHDRYLGKLFAMRYANNSRVSVYGSANNLNDTNKPDDGSGFDGTIDRTDGQVTRLSRGGVDYYVDNGRHTWSVEGNADVRYDDVTAASHSTGIDFFTGGDVYTFSNTESRKYNLSVSTDHNLKLKRESWNLGIRPRFSYRRSTGHSRSGNATFSRDVDGFTVYDIDSIFGDTHASARQWLVNRNLNDSRNSSHGISTGVAVESSFKLPVSSDAIGLWHETRYDRSTSINTNLQDIAYGGGPEASSLIWRRTSTRPNYDFFTKGAARYYFKGVGYSTFTFGYEFQFDKKLANALLLMMEARANDAMAEFAPDQVPQIDYPNSYRDFTHRYTNLFKPTWNFRKESGSKSLRMGLSPTFYAESRRLDYRRGDFFARPERTEFGLRTLAGEVTYNFDQSTRIGLYYAGRVRQASLIDMVDIVNDVDPLNIQEGNPDLRNGFSNELNLLGTWNYRKNNYLSVYGSYSATVNDIARGYRYDSATGVRRYKSYNVDGNRSTYVNVYSRTGLDRLDNHSLSVSVRYNGFNYVSLVGEDSEPVRQMVSSDTYGISLSLNSRIAEKNHIYLGVDGELRHNGSPDASISPFTTGQLRPMFSFYTEAIDRLSADTSIRWVKRYGYASSYMNEGQWVWNANINYRIISGRLNVALRAYDILGQLRADYESVSAQGRRETVSLTIPSYVMLSLTYKFNNKPRGR